MIRGIIAGKFVPPHLGHSYLISQALKHCNQLTVLVCDRPEYPIPLDSRLAWLTRIHPSVNFLAIKDVLDDNDSQAWAANTLKVLGYTPNVVFSSEAYGIDYAHYLGAKHVMIDQPRKHVPISGTKVRENPWANWQYLHPLVQAYFTRRICLVGSESSGTTTLTKALAQQYRTNWVAEYGRTYSETQHDRLAREGWKTADFITIAQRQNEREDAAAAKANKLLFCDTDSFATGIWHERYMGTRSYEVEALASARQYDVYFLTDTAIPWEHDGTRDGEPYRQWMQARFEEKLRFWNKPYVRITGTPQQRFEQACTIIELIIHETALQIPGLIRNRWHPGTGF